jgi:hypothetical protein
VASKVLFILSPSYKVLNFPALESQTINTLSSFASVTGLEMGTSLLLRQSEEGTPAFLEPIRGSSELLSAGKGKRNPFFPMDISEET